MTRGPPSILAVLSSASRHPGRVAAVLLASGALIGALAMLGTDRIDRTADGVPTFVPADPNQVIERLSPQAIASRQDLRARRSGELDLAARVALARRHLDRARRDGDPREIGYAQSALGGDWMATRPPLPVLQIRAEIRQYGHDFDGALADLGLLLEQTPGDVQAWLSRAAIEQTTGAYDRAARSCGEVVARSNAVAGRICQADLASLAGDPEAYRRARAIVTSERLDPSVRGWALTVVAEMAERLGRDADAEALFRFALAASRNGYAAVAFADWLLARDRSEAALAVLDDAASTDAVLLRRAIAYRRGKDDRAGPATEDLRQRFEAARLRDRSGERAHLREAARFALEIEGDAAAALRFATLNWSIQKEPADALLLAAAARASGRPEAADPVRRFRRQHGLVDVRLDALL